MSNLEKVNGERVLLCSFVSFLEHPKLGRAGVLLFPNPDLAVAVE